MAYVSTSLNYDGSVPFSGLFKAWTYTSTDSIATIVAAGYISDATKKGMLRGDYIKVINQSAIPSMFFCQCLSISAGAATLQVVAASGAEIQVNTALTTVGAGTITAIGLAGGTTTRGGAQSATAFTDTTASADGIITRIDNASVGRSFEYTYVNATDGAATITGGSGVTVSINTVVPANTWARYLVTYTAASTLTMVGIASGPNAALPVSKFTSIAAANGTLSAGDMEGAAWCTLASSGATAMTTRTAVQLIAGIPNAQVGSSYLLWVFNSNAGTLTLTGGVGVTITGTATIATAITRLYNVKVATATTITMQNCGAGVAS